MSATYDLTTDVGKVRRDIADRDIATAHFTDAELQSFVDEGGSVKAGAGLALIAWAAELGRGDEMVDVGNWKGDRRDVCAKMMKLANVYFEMVGYRPGVTPTLLSANMDWTPAVAVERELQEDLND